MGIVIKTEFNVAAQFDINKNLYHNLVPSVCLYVCMSVCMYVCMSVCCSLIAQKLLDGFSKFKRHMFMYGPQKGTVPLVLKIYFRFCRKKIKRLFYQFSLYFANYKIFLKK